MTVLPAIPAGEGNFRARLQALIETFDRDAAGHREAIRELADSDDEAFYAAAIEILKRGTDTRGTQFLVVLMVTHGLLLRAVCDAGLDKRQATNVARAGMRVDAMTDVALARALAESVEGAQGIAETESTRLLEILSDISDGNRIFSSLARILRFGGPNLRSKAVLMIGRGNKSPKWVRQRMADTDSRIRANAVESLWEVDSEEVRALLRAMVKDPDNRVAGNALLGLYRLGECESIPEIFARATDESAMFRASIAWVMGETGDPRFGETLAGMLKDADGRVRRCAFSALRKVRTAAQVLVEESPPCLLVARLEPDAAQSRRFGLGIASPDKSKQPVLIPSRLILAEDGLPVIQYKVQDRPLAESLAVAFVVPRGGPVSGFPSAKAAMSCLAMKRAADLWAIIRYQPVFEGTASSADEIDGAQFIANPEKIVAEFEKAGYSGDCYDVWRSIWRAVRADPRGNTKSRRQVIVFSRGGSGGIGGTGLVSAVLSSRALVQAIALAPDPSLADFCQKVNGRMTVVPNPKSAIELASHMYLNLLARYEVTYQPVLAGAKQLRVRLMSTQGWGETTIELPPSEPAT